MEFAEPSVVYFFFVVSGGTFHLCGMSFVDVCKCIYVILGVQSVPSHYSLVFMGPSRGPGLVSLVGWGHTSAVHAQ